MGKHLSLETKKKIALDIVMNKNKFTTIDKIAKRNKVHFETVKSIEKTIQPDTKIDILRKNGVEDFRKKDDLILQSWMAEQRKLIAEKSLKASNAYLDNALLPKNIAKEGGYRSILSSKIATDGALLAMGIQQATNAPQVKIYLPNTEQVKDWKVVTVEDVTPIDTIKKDEKSS